jgi:hypothetical protein
MSRPSWSGPTPLAAGRDALQGSLTIEPATMSAGASSIVGEPAIGGDAIERTTRHVWLVDHYGVLAIRSSEPQRHLARPLGLS